MYIYIHRLTWSPAPLLSLEGGKLVDTPWKREICILKCCKEAALTSFFASAMMVAIVALGSSNYKRGVVHCLTTFAGNMP